MNNKSYLILEGKDYGKYSYPDILVGTTRLSLDKELEKAIDFYKSSKLGNLNLKLIQ